MAVSTSRRDSGLAVGRVRLISSVVIASEAKEWERNQREREWEREREREKYMVYTRACYNVPAIAPIAERMDAKQAVVPDRFLEYETVWSRAGSASRPRRFHKVFPSYHCWAARFYTHQISIALRGHQETPWLKTVNVTLMNNSKWLLIRQLRDWLGQTAIETRFKIISNPVSTDESSSSYRKGK